MIKNNKKRNVSPNPPGNQKSFRISSRTLFIIYPKLNQKNGSKLSKEVMKAELEEKFKGNIKTIIVSEEISDNAYEHFHAYLALYKKVDIRKHDFLDIRGNHGSYESIRNKNRSIDYVTKDKDYVSEGYDAELHPLTRYPKDPFRSLVYAHQIKNVDPETLVKRAYEMTEETFSEELLLLRCDYMQHTEKYEKLFRESREVSRKRLKDSWVREDITNQLMEWTEKGIKNEWIDKTLYVEGAPGTGKSALTRQLFDDQCLTVRDLNQTKDIDMKKYKGLIFDDTSIKYLGREQKLSLIETDEKKVIDVKYGTREILTNIITCFINNHTPRQYFSYKEDKAFTRRLQVIRVNHIGHEDHLYGNNRIIILKLFLYIHHLLDWAIIIQ